MKVLLALGFVVALAMPAQAQISPLGGTTGQPAGVQDPGTSVPPRTMRAPRGRRSGHTVQERFEAANTAHDGRLTLAQAAAMPRVARNFDAIDTGRKGYVTIDDIRSYNRAQRAERKAERSGTRQ